jgi:MoaA/NifB/PqqE/SkfB family radical SAM enzyme
VRKRRGDELDLDQCKQVIDTYRLLGTKSFEVTGGGDPLMHKDLLQILDHLGSSDIGLITNGLKIPQFDPWSFKNLTWMRISLSGLEQDRLEDYLAIDPAWLPNYVGCSLLIKAPWGDAETAGLLHLLDDARTVADHLGAKYVRLVPDCFDTSEIEWLQGISVGHTRIEPYRADDYAIIERLRGLPDFFMQTKPYTVPPVCYWRYIKPFVNADGWVYQCSTCALFEERFPEGWRAARIGFIDNIYEGDVTSFDTSGCKLCFYSGQNQLVHELMREVIHREFV